MAEGTPVYVALADELAVLVASLQPGDRLPSENELVEVHGVSRLTARAALQELEARLLVRRVRGAGTFVVRRIDVRLGPDAPFDWAEAVRRSGGVATRSVLSVRTRRPTAAVRDGLDVDADDRVTSLVRTGCIDGIPAVHETVHLPSDLVPDLAERAVDAPSIVGLLHAYDMAPERLWLRAELATLPGDVATALELDGRPLGWTVESCLHDPALGRPIALGHRWLRADLHRVVVDLGSCSRVDG